VLDGMHAHRSFTNRGSAFDRFQVGNSRINRRLVLEVFASELEAEIDRRRLQFQRDFFTGMQRCAADARAPGESLLGLGRHKGLN